MNPDQQKEQAEKVADLWEHDPHQWSTRPCPTCREITAIIGRKFGCYAVAAGEYRHYRGEK